MLSDFAKEKVFWTRKMNLKLVKFIEARPHIWNPKHAKYTSAELRDQTYAEFAAKYGNEFTGRAVKERWTNIRSTFANYLRKIKTNTSNGQNEDYKIRWHLWESCQFLLKANRRQKVDSAELDTNYLQDMEMVKDECESKDVFLSEAIVNGNIDKEPENDDNMIANSINCNEMAESLLTVFKGVQNDPFGLINTKYGKIGRTVAKKLGRMNSFDAARLSNKIMNILLMYDKNNPDNPNIKDNL